MIFELKMFRGVSALDGSYVHGEGAAGSGEPAEFEKTIVFIVIFLKNSKHFVIFTKSSNKFGEFSNFLGFSNIFLDFHVFYFIFFNFLEFSRAF